MQVEINNIAYEIPFETELITISEFIDWHNQYGMDLNAELRTIFDNKDMNEIERMSLIQDYLDTEALCWFAFWTKISLKKARFHPNISPFLEKYKVLRSLLNENDFQFPYQFEWRDSKWNIEDYKLNPASEMDFNEIVTSKETMRQVYKIGEDNWTGIPYLCCIFLRKENEKFNDSFIYEGSERMELFKSLPLKHALAVAFFLNNYVNIWKKGSASSAKKVQVAANLNWLPFMKSGDGLIFSRQLRKADYSPRRIILRRQKRQRHIIF